MAGDNRLAQHEHRRDLPGEVADGVENCVYAVHNQAAAFRRLVVPVNGFA